MKINFLRNRNPLNRVLNLEKIVYLNYFSVRKRSIETLTNFISNNKSFKEGSVIRLIYSNRKIVINKSSISIGGKNILVKKFGSNFKIGKDEFCLKSYSLILNNDNLLKARIGLFKIKKI
jgi:hypothetical protein